MQQEPLIKPHWKIVILDVILRTSYLVFVFFLTPLDVSDFLFFPLRGPWDLSQAVRGWPRLTSILIWSCSLRCERWWGYLTEPSSPTMSVPSGVCPSWWPPPGQRLWCSPLQWAPWTQSALSHTGVGSSTTLVSPNNRFRSLRLVVVWSITW